MNFLTDARAELKDLLEDGGYRTYDYRPDRLTPPCVVVEFGDPYLIPGQAFGEWEANLQLTAYVAPATNQQSTEQLDQAITELVEILRGSWSVQTVSAGSYDVGDKAYVGAAIQIKNQLTKEPA